MRRLAIVIVLIGGVARADVDPQTKADVIFERAQAAYQAGKFQAAIELFKDAYELVHDPVYLFNIAQSYRKVLDCVAANDYYARYLEAAPNAENKDKVRQWVRELSPCVEQRRKDEEAKKKLDEIERQKQVDAERQRQAAAAPHQHKVDRGKPLRVAGMLSAGAGVIGLAIGVGFSIRGTSLKNQVANDCAASCVWDQEKSLDASGKRANTIAAISYVAGGVAVIAGASLFVWGRVRMESVAVTPTPGGATAAVSMRF